MKKVLFLGAAHAQIPPILYAKTQGYIVYTADNKPLNPGHAFANKSFNISTTSKEEILQLARTLEIDGIISYASDPAAPTAAYVGEKMKIPGNPYASVDTLVNKSKFRNFLKFHNFKSPRSHSFNDIQEAIKWARLHDFPLFIKPVDSSGSKGVTKIDQLSELKGAYAKAERFSLSGQVVIEEEIPRALQQIDSDIFMLDGNISFWVWGDQRQDPLCHEYAPIGISFPSLLPTELQLKAKNTIEAILQKLNFKFGAFNVEFLIDKNNDVWVIEIGPRNGGNLIPEVIQLSTGADMVEWTVEAALGHQIDISAFEQKEDCASSYLIHSQSDGIFEELFIHQTIKEKIVKMDLFVNRGDCVKRYEGSNTTLGTAIIKFESREEMTHYMDEIETYISVKLR